MTSKSDVIINIINIICIINIEKYKTFNEYFLPLKVRYLLLPEEVLGSPITSLQGFKN